MDEKFLKNTHISTNILVIRISKSQTQIYNISQKMKTFQK